MPPTRPKDLAVLGLLSEALRRLPRCPQLDDRTLLRSSVRGAHRGPLAALRASLVLAVWAQRMSLD